MKAVVLCAGKGTRIREVTGSKIPKPMIEIDGKPILAQIIENLSDSGVEEVLINLHHKGEKIEERFGTSYKGVEISYYWEEELLGTAGALNQMKDDLNDDFLVVYGDIISNLNLGSLADFHKSQDSIGTILVYKGEEDLSKSSIIDIDNENKIKRFVEKPGEEFISNFKGDIWTNAGIYCFSPEIIEFIGEGKIDFAYDVFPSVLESPNSLSAFELPEDAYWKEVGNPERYEQLKKDVDSSKIEW